MRDDYEQHPGDWVLEMRPAKFAPCKIGRRFWLVESNGRLRLVPMQSQAGPTGQQRGQGPPEGALSILPKFQAALGSVGRAESLSVSCLTILDTTWVEVTALV